MSYAAILRSAGVLAAAALSAAPVFAGEEPTLDKADTAWMMVSTILVLFMTIPGIALFHERGRAARAHEGLPPAAVYVHHPNRADIFEKHSQSGIGAFSPLART